jgi:non-specific serine/threonine protein kinase
MSFARISLADHCHQVGAWSEGRAVARAAIELDPESLLNGASAVAHLAWMEGRHSDALRELTTHLADARARDDVQGVTIALYVLADSLLQLGRAPEAEAPAREGAELACTRWRGEIGCAMEVLAETLARLGTSDAENVISDAQQVIDDFEIEAARPQVLRARGLLLLRRGDVDEAIAVLQSSAEVARSQHALIEYGRTLSVLAQAARQCGDQTLLAQAAAERAAVVDTIGPEVRNLDWARGLPSPSRRKREHMRSSGADEAPLSPREREVAELVARGLSNRQIAERLVITPGTAGVHVGHVMNKLGVHTRAEIASWTIRQSPGAGSPSSDSAT